MELPSHARIVFPGIFATPPIHYYGGPGYTNLKLVLPQGFHGSLHVPLLLHTVRGRGQVRFAGQEFEVDSAELQAEIDLRAGPGHEMEVLEARTDLEIIFLMNPMRWQLRPSNALAFDVLSAGEAWVGAARLGVPGDDSDSDGVPDDGDASGVVGDRPCASGEPAGCDDNCSFAANPAQRDGDSDRAGNACDGDLTGDGFVWGDDLQWLAYCIAADPVLGVMAPGCPGADLDEDGVLGTGDQERLMALIGREPSPHAEIEAPQPACGLGFEVAPLLLAWAVLRRRRSRCAGGVGRAPRQ
jgi:hypothetical protein